MDINFNKIQPLNINSSAQDKVESQADKSNARYADYKSIYDSGSGIENLAFKANALAQVPVGYKEIQSFEVPYLSDKGKIYQLDNGQKVVIIPKKGPTAIDTYVKVGSFNEPERIEGISHYIEHNIFNGSKNMAPGEFVKNTTYMGGEYNAGTGTLSTNYYIESPLHKDTDLEKFISMHADMLQNPTFLQNMLDKEKGPVISEIYMYKDMPDAQAGNDLIKNLFNMKTNNALISGSPKSIKNMTRQDVLDYYNKWYTPDNMTTIIVGDVNPNEAIKLVSKYFNSTKKPVNPETKYCIPLNNVINSTRRADYVSSGVSSVDLQMAFVGPKNNDRKDTVAARALCVALIGFENAKLNKALEPFNTGAAVGVRTISPYINDPQVIQLAANFKPGDEEKGLQTIYSAMYELSQKPVSEAELNIIKEKMLDGLSIASEHSMVLSNFIGESIVNNGDLKFYTELPNAVKNLTAEDIQEAAREYLDLNKASIIMVHPQSQKIQNTAAPAASAALSFGSRKSLSFKGHLDGINMKNVKEYNLNNNLHLVVNKDPYAIKTSAVVGVQTDTFPPSKPGVSEILSIMLNESTKNYPAEQLSGIIDDNNLDISVGAGPKAISFATNCNNEKVPLALGLMREMLYNPNLTQENFDKAKEQLRINCMSTPKDPEDRIYELLYGDHPYGYSTRKILENIDNLTLQDVTGFYNSIMQNPSASAVGVVTGNLDKTPGLQTQIYNSLNSSIPTLKKFSYDNTFDSPPVDKNTVITEVADRDQAHIVQMFKIKESGNIKDQVTLELLNKILGGNSQSRLFLDLRESQKLAYRVKSIYTTNGRAGELRLLIKTTTRGGSNGNVPKYENVQKSLDGFNKHINELIDTPVSQEELEGAKLAVKSDLLNSLEASAGKTAMLITGLNSYYGPDYTNQLLETVDKITPEDIQKAANIYLTQPSVTSVLASKDTIDNTKDYLSTKGNVVQY